MTPVTVDATGTTRSGVSVALVAWGSADGVNAVAVEASEPASVRVIWFGVKAAIVGMVDLLRHQPGLTLPEGDAVSIVMVGPAARDAVTPSTRTNGNGHPAGMGDSPATIRALIQGA